MSELYTSLSRLKQAMGGTLPPMTPIPEHVQHIIDPSLTIGLGAIEEDERKGLRCPVRGCGQYFHRLKQHIDQKHADIGGSARVLGALEIPRKVSLTSQVGAATMRQARVDVKVRGSRVRVSAETTRKSRDTRTANLRSMNGRNARNLCEAQVQERFERMERQLGRSPSMADACDLGERNFMYAVIELYGSWSAAKAQFGLAVRTAGGQRPRTDRNAVLRAMQAYYDVHGDLPLSTEIANPTRTPLTPCLMTILRTLSHRSWLDCAQEIAATLGIHSERYSKARADKVIPVPPSIVLTLVRKNAA